MAEQYDWRFENSISVNKKYVDDIAGYNSWRTNRYFSNFIDTIFSVNEMNIHYDLDSKLQYDYLFYSVYGKKRFYKRKTVVKDDNFSLVQQYYKYNNARTKEALKLLSAEQLDIIKQKQQKGGVP